MISLINEIAQETQCFTLPSHSTHGRFDFTNIIIEKEIFEARTRGFRIASNARSPLDQAVTLQHRNRIEYYNIFIVLTSVHDLKRLSPIAFTKAN